LKKGAAGDDPVGKKRGVEQEEKTTEEILNQQGRESRYKTRRGPGGKKFCISRYEKGQTPT